MQAVEPIQRVEPVQRAPDAYAVLAAYMADCRSLVLEELAEMLPRGNVYADVLYGRMLEYPLRGAKALRPALCIATCRGLGGTLDGISKTAAVLELYHNAFLIHDDVEDRSEKRRDELTLHRMYGVPIAVNVGDAMLALALEPLLDNMGILGMGKALRILRAVARMAKESAEGQALELDWVRAGRWHLRDADYLRMVYKKTTWYSFVAPMELGALAVGADAGLRYRLRRFAVSLGAAFQIQDDLLNLRADEVRYGKEILGDLWEGKHTLILAHALRRATLSERRRAAAILVKPRPPTEASANVEERLRNLVAQGVLTVEARRRVEETFRVELGTGAYKTESDVEFLAELIERYDSCRYAEQHAQRRARRALHSLDAVIDDLSPGPHRDFFRGLADFVITRDH